jgi:hypothetical protein
MIALRPSMVGGLDATITIEEAKGMQHLVLTNVFAVMILIGLALCAAYAMSDSFDFSKRGELHWLYITLAVLVFSLLFSSRGNSCSLTSPSP